MDIACVHNDEIHIDRGQRKTLVSCSTTVKIIPLRQAQQAQTVLLLEQLPPLQHTPVLESQMCFCGGWGFELRSSQLCTAQFSPDRCL